MNSRFKWKRASVSLILFFFSFLCFLIIFYMCEQTIYYINILVRLVFIIPSLTFLVIGILTGKNKLNAVASNTAISILVPIFLIFSFIHLIVLSLQACSVTINDVNKYERTMRLAGVSKSKHLAIFPYKIPKNTENVIFYYEEDSWLDYTQRVILRFNIDNEAIQNYAKEYSKKAKRIDNASSEYGADISDNFAKYYLDENPEHYVIYTNINRDYDKTTLSVVSINQTMNHIIFYAHDFTF